MNTKGVSKSRDTCAVSARCVAPGIGWKDEQIGKAPSRPPECISITTRPSGKIRVFTKFAIRYEMVPREFPGKARFILTPSRGDTRELATHALSLNCGMRITRPAMRLGSR